MTRDTERPCTTIEIEALRREVMDAISRVQAELREGNAELERGKADLAKGLAALAKGNIDLKIGRDELRRGIAELQLARTELDALRDAMKGSITWTELRQRDHTPNALTAETLRKSNIGVDVMKATGVDDLSAQLGLDKQ